MNKLRGLSIRLRFWWWFRFHTIQEFERSVFAMGGKCVSASPEKRIYKLDGATITFTTTTTN